MRATSARVGSSTAGAAGANCAPADNIQRIVDLEAEELLKRSFGDRVGDRIVAMAGSPACALIHALFFGGWIAANTGLFPRVQPFDPFPFSFLGLVVSLEVIFLSLAVLNNQSRMTRLGYRRTHLDLQINLLAEAEATAALRLLRQIARHLRVPVDGSTHQAAELAAETDIEGLAKELDDKLPS